VRTDLPHGVIYWQGDLPDYEQQHLGDNAAFSAKPCQAEMLRSTRQVMPPR